MRWIGIRSRSQPKNSGGSRHSLSGIFIDITDRKAAESEVERKRGEVAHLTRVSMLGELSGAIAHEINQPLTAILSNAYAALDMLPPDGLEFEELRDTLRDIIQEDNRASEVINRLRRLLKKGTKTFETFDINEMIVATVGLLRSETVNRKIQLNLDLEPYLPQTSGDFIQIQQVLLNLTMNAMDAMNETPESHRLLTIASRTTSSETIEVTVKDNGTGINESARLHLFEPFFSTKENGLGLGLSICFTIIEAHGGKLTLVNDGTGGAIASFHLSGAQVSG
ncbi:histidine kinase OS=Afipia felis OX=1035 GN=fixL_3 PE=4 SV=1 [Afipia felis]